MKYYAYIIKSDRYKKNYIGSTSNIEKGGYNIKELIKYAPIA